MLCNLFCKFWIIPAETPSSVPMETGNILVKASPSSRLATLIGFIAQNKNELNRCGSFLLTVSACVDAHLRPFLQELTSF